jgi:hypothetical protein
MKNIIYFLYSQDQEILVQCFDKFDKESIKKAIINHLKKYKDDVLELCKKLSKTDFKKYYGNEILNFYQNNKNGIPCLVLTKNNKEYFKPLKN